MTLFDLISNKTYQYKHVLTKLIEHHTGIFYKDVLLHYEKILSDTQVNAIDSDYRSYVHDHKPLEYIMGEVSFLGNEFIIDKRAMIPRPETEYMIQAVIESIDNNTNRVSPIHLLDLGCGCGVLGISVCLLSKSSHIRSLNARDISEDAIDLSNENAQRYAHQLMHNHIIFYSEVSDGLKNISYHPEQLSQWKKDNLIIICNYPYIPDETFDQNADECAKRREPRSAFVGGKDGLDLYRILFGEIKEHGLTHAVLYLEMMTRQMDILIKEFGGKQGENRVFTIVKTFHFNIIIVQAILENNLQVVPLNNNNL